LKMKGFGVLFFLVVLEEQCYRTVNNSFEQLVC
jgi:hypothetical protein